MCDFLLVGHCKYSSIRVKIKGVLQGGGSWRVEMCMGMGKTGIPWVPWDSHGNGNKVSHGMGMGWEWEVGAWEWELRRGNGKKTAHCKQQALAISPCVSVFA